MRLFEGGAVHVQIPAEMLKLLEDYKDGDPFDVVWHNARLAAVLEEYRRYFRPLFDDGSCLFPSVHAPDQVISEKQLGRLTGDITKRAFKVRIPIHRFRDNVATDSSENMTGGRLATAVLLDQGDIATGDHYDHSDGRKAQEEFGEFINFHRSAPAELFL